MNQRKYALKSLSDASILACKPAVTRIDNHVKYSSIRIVSFTDVHAYKRLFGRLRISLIPEVTTFLYSTTLSIS